MLELNSVDVTVIYSKREDGFKFSIRSENKNIDAGSVINLALSDVGSGGGHPSMAGGIIKTEDIYKLGDNPDEEIIKRFTYLLGETVK